MTSNEHERNELLVNHKEHLESLEIIASLEAKLKEKDEEIARLRDLMVKNIDRIYSLRKAIEPFAEIDCTDLSMEKWFKRLENHDYYTGMTCPCHEGMPLLLTYARATREDTFKVKRAYDDTGDKP